jgi:hypothetical protein
MRKIEKQRPPCRGRYPRHGAQQEVKIMSLNKAMAIGRLGQDPEIRYAPTGLPIVTFSVATDEPYLDKERNRQERTEWHSVVVIGKLGGSAMSISIRATSFR